MIDPDKRNALNIMRPQKSGAASEGDLLLEKLLRTGFINPLVLQGLPEKSRGELTNQVHGKQMLAKLVELELLTSYQADRIRSDNLQGMILGNYRVLGRLGGGKDGVIFSGEHRDTGLKVAIKVLIPARDQDPKPMLRFFAERKTVAQLSHPGIVSALDIGETRSEDPDEPVLYYYVMELVPGLDLELHVKQNGPMSPGLACDVAYQVADALTEAHKHNLVHRDVKPSNIILTPEGKAMLLDFGVVRQFHSRQTVIGSLVGVLEWIAPEQLKDAHSVDIRADIYSLGCTLFWCLTGQSPNGLARSPSGSQAPPPTQLPPRRVRAVRSDITAELDVVVAHMMAVKPDHRYPDPQAVMTALVPFVSEKYALAVQHAPPDAVKALPAPTPVSSTSYVLIVDDDPLARRMCREVLQMDGIACEESTDGELALLAAAKALPDLVLLSFELPGMTGLEVLQQLRQTSSWEDRKIIMMIGDDCDIRRLLAAGADDYLTKPIDSIRLRMRVKSALQFKQTQDDIRHEPPPVGRQASDPQIEADAEVQSKTEGEAEVPSECAKARSSFWRPALNWLFGKKNESI